MLEFKPDIKKPEECIDIVRANKKPTRLPNFIDSFWADNGVWTFGYAEVTATELRQIADKLDELNKENIK